MGIRGKGSGRRKVKCSKDKLYNQSSLVVMVTSLQSRLMEVLPIVRLDTSTL